MNTIAARVPRWHPLLVALHWLLAPPIVAALASGQRMAFGRRTVSDRA